MAGPRRGVTKSPVQLQHRHSTYNCSPRLSWGAAVQVLMLLLVVMAAGPLGGSHGGELRGTCVWHDVTEAPELVAFTDAELEAVRISDGTVNCSTADLRNRSLLLPPSNPDRSWLLFIVDAVVQANASDSVSVVNASRLILTAPSDVSVDCLTLPNYHSINRSEIFGQSFHSNYTVDRAQNRVLLLISNSSDVILAGLRFRYCVSNDLEPAALQILSSSNVSVNNCTFRENFGPAASVAYSGVTLSGTTFTNNIRFGEVFKRAGFLLNQASSGLAIVVGGQGCCEVRIESCLFSTNINTQTELDKAANLRGGHAGGLSINVRGAPSQISINISNTVFRGNAVRQFGGGMYMNFIRSRGVLFTVYNCRFVENVAETLGGGMAVFFSEQSYRNTAAIQQTRFYSNLAGIGGAIAIPMVSEETVRRHFDGNFYEFAPGVINESFPISVPAENYIRIEDSEFVANAARGSGSSVSMLMLFQLTTSPLPARINNCIFTGHQLWNSTVPSGSATLYDRVVARLYHPEFNSAENLLRLFKWTTAKCILMCDEIPVQFGTGTTRFLSNNMRATVVRAAAVYILGTLEMSGNINSDNDGFNLQSYGAGLVLFSHSQLYVTNSSRLFINDNFAAFGAGIYSLSSLTSASFVTANDDEYLHGCFVIFSSPSFTYQAAADSSEARFRFVNNTAWKGSAIYSSTMRECTGWWRSRDCVAQYPKDKFTFANNSACNFAGFLTYENCTEHAAEMAKQAKVPCSQLNTSEALKSDQVHCEAVATDGFQEHWMISGTSSPSDTTVVVSPGQSTGVKATLLDQNCNPSELNAKLEVQPQDILDIQHLHFKVSGVSDFSFVSYAADYPFFASERERTVNISLQPQVSTFELYDIVNLRIGQCGAGYFPNGTSPQSTKYTCACLKTNDVMTACGVAGHTGIVVKSGVWVSNASAEGNLTYHTCPYGYCKPFCGRNRSSAAYGSGRCCESTAGHRGCFFDSTKPNSLCNKGRKGIMCGSCPRGHGVVHGQWLTDCTACPNRPTLLIIPVVLVSGFVALLVIFDLQLPYFVWIFVHYIQVSSYLPNSFNDKFFTAILYLQYYTSMDFLYGACVFGSMTVLENSVLNLFAFAVMVVALSAIFLFICVFYWKHRKRFFRRLRTAFLTCFQLMYFNMWLGCINVVNCVDLKFDRGVERRLLADGNVLCWQGHHLKYSIPVLCFMCLVLIPAPFLLAAFNHYVANSSDRVKRNTWFGSGAKVGATWWFSWDMVRKASIIIGFSAISEVTVHQSVRLITFCVDLVLTALCNGGMFKEGRWRSVWLAPRHSMLQSVSLVLLSLLQLLWVAFFVTSQDPSVPIGLLSFLESIPVVLMVLWIARKVLIVACQHFYKTDELDADADASWSEISAAEARVLPIHRRFIRTITNSGGARPGRARPRDRGKVDEGGYMRPVDSDVLLAGRAPAYHKRRKLNEGDSSDSDAYDEEYD